MDRVTKEKINQIVSRTDVSENQKADMIEEFAEKYAKSIIIKSFCNGQSIDFKECTIEKLEETYEKINELINWADSV